MAQCFGNVEDHGTKGRMMPVHYSSPELGFHTITSPLATQYVHRSMREDYSSNGEIGCRKRQARRMHSNWTRAEKGIVSFAISAMVSCSQQFLSGRHETVSLLARLMQDIGAASEGDFHAALGMNSVLGGPCIWFCRNNG